MQFDLIIKNGVVVTSGDTGRLDIGIKDGVITTLAADIPADLGAKIIDAEGGYVMPGGVDAHVHFAQDFNSGPSGVAGSCADDFETGSRSAVCGGTTTVIAFAMQNRNDKSLIKVVEDYHQLATGTGSYCDWAYHLIISRPDMDMLRRELPLLVEQWGITSVKLFMTYAALQLSDYELLDVMYEARRLAITTRLEERGMVEPGYHAESRPPIVEAEATNRAIVLAEMIQNPILFVHVGSATAAEVIRKTQTRGYPIYAETCPQYLHLTWEDLKRFHSPQCFENSKMICSPPPGPGKDDQEAIWTGLRNGTFNIFSSDHCAFRYNDVKGKAVGVLEHAPSMSGVTCSIDNDHVEEIMHGKTGHFKYVPNGCPGVETRLPLLFNYGVEEGRITAERFVELTSTGPAKMRYGLYPKKGGLLPGLSDADLVIWYPKGQMDAFGLLNEHLHHNADYTPYEGMRFENWPRYTILKGKVVWEQGQLVGSKDDGQYLKRAASQNTRDAVQSIRGDKGRVATWLHE